MLSYLRFETDDGVPIILEAEVDELPEETGPQKAGLPDRLRQTIATTQEAVEQAIQAIMRYHGRVFASAIKGLENKPDEAELSFGLKAAGELGNFVITRISGEVNYGVRLVWRNDSRNQADTMKDQSLG
jgi:hypothetical protein